MAQFDESKVISPLHPEKAEVGKKYWVSDELVDLKEEVEKEKTPYELIDVKECCLYPFITSAIDFQFLYPYEEPPKKRMTKRMLGEWCAKGNGEYSYRVDEMILSYTEYDYGIRNGNEEVDDYIVIRTWDSDEWIEPTVDIYKRDCKKEN